MMRKNCSLHWWDSILLEHWWKPVVEGMGGCFLLHSEVLMGWVVWERGGGRGLVVT